MNKRDDLPRMPDKLEFVGAFNSSTVRLIVGGLTDEDHALGVAVNGGAGCVATVELPWAGHREIGTPSNIGATAQKIVSAYNAQDDLVAALRPFADMLVRDDSICHRGIVEKEKCCRCGPILRARALLAEIDGGRR